MGGTLSAMTPSPLRSCGRTFKGQNRALTPSYAEESSGGRGCRSPTRWRWRCLRLPEMVNFLFGCGAKQTPNPKLNFAALRLMILD